MIIWGTKFVKKTVGTGTFLCPHCAAEKPYKKISGQKHGHVYWIPLFSMGEAIDYVECQDCKAEWQPSVLSYSPSASQDAFGEQYRRLLREIVVSIAAADGNLASEEIEMAQRIYQSFTGGAGISEDEIRTTARSLDASQMMTLFDQLGPQLTDEGREYLMKAAILIASCDGHVHDKEATLLGYFANGLGMSETHVRGVMAELDRASTNAPA